MANYCSECGKGMTEEQKFCPFCGTPANGKRNTASTNISLPKVDFKQTAKNLQDKIGKTNFIINKTTVLSAICFFALLMNAILVNQEIIRIDVASLFGSSAQTFKLFYDLDPLGGITTFLYILIMLLIAGSIFLKQLQKKIVRILPIIINSWSVIWYIIISAIYANETSDYGNMAKVKLSTAGFFFLFFCITGIVTAVFIMRESKRVQQSDSVTYMDTALSQNNTQETLDNDISDDQTDGT